MSTLALVGLLVVLLVAIGIAGFLLRGRRGASADPAAPPRTVAELVDRRRASAGDDGSTDDAGSGERARDAEVTGVVDEGAAEPGATSSGVTDVPDDATTPIATSPAATATASTPDAGHADAVAEEQPGPPPVGGSGPAATAEDASVPTAADTGPATAGGADTPVRSDDATAPAAGSTAPAPPARRPGSDADTGASSPPWSRAFVGGRQITPPVAGPAVEKRADDDGTTTRPSPPPRQESRSPVDPDLVKRVTSVPSTSVRRSNDPDTEREFREARDRMSGPVAGRHSRVPEQSTRSPEPEATARPRPTPVRRERPSVGGAAAGLTGAGIAASALSFRPSGNAGDDGPGTDEGTRPSPFPRATDTGSGDEPPPRPAPRVMRSTGPLGAADATEPAEPTATEPTASEPTATEPTEPTATVPVVDEPAGSETTGTSASAVVATGAVVAGAVGAAAVASPGDPAVVDAPATDPTTDPAAADDAAGAQVVEPTAAQAADHDTGSDTTVSSAPAVPSGTVEEEPVAFAATSAPRPGPVPSTPAQDVEVEVGDGSHRPLAGVSLSTVDSSGAAAGETTTGADGTARLRAPGAGRYLLVASATGFETRVTPYTVADEPVRVPVTLTRSSSLHGAVGAGVSVVLSQDGDEIARTDAGADGHYRFDALGAGHYLLTTDRGPGSTVHVPAETDVEHDVRDAEGDGVTTHAEGRLTGVGGVDLFWQGWLPDGEPSGVLLISHGIGEHSGRYGNVVDEVIGDGWAVYGLDHRGHGRSGGTRVHVRSYSELVDDFESFRRVVAARHPGLPVFLLGHSLGGQIALAYTVAHERELSGLVVSAPALASDVIPGFLVPVLSAVARVLPTVRPVGIDESKISRDAGVVADYRADPLVHHGNPTLSLGAAIYQQMDVLPGRVADLRLPILVQHGTDDALTDPAGTRRLEDSSGSPDTTVLWYEGFWHEIYNEPDRARPLADLREWLAARRASTPVR